MPRNETCVPEEIPPIELDTYLGVWLLSLHMPNGQEYEPDSLTSHHQAVNRYL